MPHADCPICVDVKAASNDNLPLLIHEFEHGVLVLGEHQLYPGYCVLYSSIHAREFFELDSTTLHGLWQALRLSCMAVHRAMKPIKVNVACYGNHQEHVHWHIIPRYEDDHNPGQSPLLSGDALMQAEVTPDAAEPLIQQIRAIIHGFILEAR